jgi:glycosyltransferase involved in cell wall biosynthesis
VTSLRIAVLLPCYNEGLAIAKVIHDFQGALPQANIYVYDNNSTDDTMQKAKDAGAIVRREAYQGKGYVVKRMFADIEADIYIMADGDGTYDHSIAPQMIALLLENQLDMVVGQRIGQEGAYRRGHKWGNCLFNWFLKKLFRSHFQDIFSGYRVFTRRFVKSFPALSSGFDIETELSVHALELGLSFAEVPCAYKKRLEGAESKLRTYTDGFKILLRMVSLFKHQRPLMFFGLWAAASASLGFLLFLPIWETYYHTGLVPRFPTAILCTALIILSMIFITCGLVLDSLSYTRTILKRLLYLNSGSSLSEIGATTSK